MVYKYIQKVKHLQRGSPLQKETQIIDLQKQPPS